MRDIGPQTKAILRCLWHKCSLTSREAIQFYKCHRLAARIYDLRRMYSTRDPDGLMRYWMPRPKSRGNHQRKNS